VEAALAEPRCFPLKKNRTASPHPKTALLIMDIKPPLVGHKYTFEHLKHKILPQIRLIWCEFIAICPCRCFRGHENKPQITIYLALV
jgi:hypothetical protein